MRKKKIEKQLNNAISNMVPDVLDKILAQCEEREGLETMKFKKDKKEKALVVEEKTIKRRFFTPKLIGAMATVVICAFGILGVNQYQKTMSAVDTVIDFDVNPSVEIKTNKKEEIVEVNALNDEGKTILQDMDLENVDLDVAVNALIGSMLKNGYISEAQNSILVSVKNDDEIKAKNLEEKISKDIDELLKAQNIQGSILSQMYNDDDEMEKLAKQYNISEGKAELINRIVKAEMKDSKGNVYTFESLSKLSINELNVLLNSKNVVLNNVISTGNASETGLIGQEKAKEIAFTKAGVTATTVSELEVELDCDDGVLVYEVEFRSGNNEYEYEYDIHAKDGTIVKENAEIEDDYNDDDDNDDRPVSVTPQTNYQNNNQDDDDKYDDDYDDRYDDNNDDDDNDDGDDDDNNDDGDDDDDNDDGDDDDDDN